MSEFDLIQQIRSASLPSQPGTVLGIGDDAAVLRPPPGYDLVSCVDTLVAGVHYPGNTAAADIGYKSLAVNLSDLAAMGAQPLWATLALTLDSHDPAWIRDFLTGFAAAAQPFDVDLVGGDTTQGPQVITVQAMGAVPPGEALCRTGAQAGDRVVVTGTIGDAALALHQLQCGEPVDEYLLGRLNRPSARVSAGLQVRNLVTSAIDISDGFVQDLKHVLKASNVGAKVQMDAMPASEPMIRAAAINQQHLQLTGGDDYELCLTVPQNHIDEVLTRLDAVGCGGQVVGEILAQPGICIESSTGELTELGSLAGYEHF